MLILLHGFLGGYVDWDVVISHLPTLDVQPVDLPYLEKDIPLFLHKKIRSAKMLVGYSAGGRIALEMKVRFPDSYEKLMLVSSHLGLESGRKARIEQDQKWIDMLREQSLDTFLEKWYAQPLFQSLRNHPSFEHMLYRRKKQKPEELIAFLQNYGLGKTKKHPLPKEAICIYGKEDLKYAQHYRTIGSAFAIENAGHAVHLENPKELARHIYEHYTKFSQ